MAGRYLVHALIAAMLALALPASAAGPGRTLTAQAAASAERRVALVIGNGAYPGVGALKNPANDARDIAARLTRLGFEVIVRTDVRQKEMLRSLTEFGDKVQAGTEALFFYAGHGMQVRGKNYLIPIDAEIRGESSVSSEAVDVDQLLDKLAPARLSLVILDACRNNPFERRFRGSGQGLAQINAPTGTLIAYATAPGKVAADGEGRNGLYTAELLAAMDVPGIRIEDVFKRVRANVVRKSGEAQTPWESSSLTGDFYFIAGNARTESAAAATPLPAPVAEPASTAIELAFWNSIKDSRNPDDFKAYLDRYPEGGFVPLASNRIAEIMTARARLVRRDEDPDGIWQGQLETYGGLFEQPVKVDVKLLVAGGRIDGEVFMYGENRRFIGNVDDGGRLANARLVGSLQAYDLSGTLSQAHGEGAMGWKLRMTLKKSTPARAEVTPEAAGRSPAPDITGLWHWSVKSFLVPDRTNTVNADGTCLLNTGTTCIWTYEDGGKRNIAFRFSDTWTHKMTLAEDGRTMKGTDNWGTAVTATKAGGK